jgi:hypothetical protein
LHGVRQFVDVAKREWRWRGGCGREGSMGTQQRPHSNPTQHIGLSSELHARVVIIPQDVSAFGKHGIAVGVNEDRSGSTQQAFKRTCELRSTGDKTQGRGGGHGRGMQGMA